MPEKFNKKTSFVALVVFILSLFANSAVLAAAGTGTALTPFKDVSTSFWGGKDIAKMYVRGVTSGYNDGSFQPNNQVTQLEAVLMAVKNMANPSQLVAVDASQPLPVTVPQWAQIGNKKDILFAVQKGLIVPAEKNFNASAKANRAWVAQLMVRMINKDDEASDLAGKLAAVKDAADIPLWAVGYINTAYKYNLIAGYPDNSFKPNQNVTRAELVAILSRSEQYLDLSGSYITGKVLSVTGQNISLAVNSIAKSYTIDSGTWVFDSNGKLTNAGFIKKDDVLKILVSGTAVKYAEFLPANSVLTTIKGNVLQVIAKDKVVVVKDNNQVIHTEKLADNAAVSSQNGDITDLSQVTTGCQVELSMNSAGVAVALKVLNSGAASTLQGIIYQINQDQKLIIIKNSTGKLSTYQYSDQILVKISQARFPSINDLQAGDEVKLTITGGIVNQVDMVQVQQQATVTGTVIVVSAEKRILTIQKSNGGLEALQVSDTAPITISGNAAGQLSNILANDSVELTVEKGIVTAVKVNDRKAETVVTGTVAAVDTTNRIITLQTATDGLKAYEVSSSAQFSINDSTTPYLSNVKKDMKVELQIVDNKVIYLELKNTVEGTVVTVDLTRRLLTVDNGSTSKAYVLDSSVDVDIDGVSSAGLSNINKNDFVSIRIENNAVTKVNVRRTFTYEVTDVFTNNNELRVKDSNGDSRYLSLNNLVTLVVPGIDHPGVGDFAVGSVIKATFLGARLDKVEVAAVTRGKVTAVNSYNNTVTLQLFDTTSKVCNFTANSEVVTGSQVNSQISSLLNGDRVEVRENTKGGLSFLVMTKVSGKFGSYTDDGSKIYVAKDPMTWLNYAVSAKVYIHHGTESLGLRTLAKDDQLDLYLLNNTVYEIEKK